MIEVRLECKNVKVEKIANWLSKFGKSFEYKVWEYSNTFYASFRVGSLSNLDALERKLKQNRIEFHFSRINSNLTLWEKIRSKVFA